MRLPRIAIAYDIPAEFLLGALLGLIAGTVLGALDLLMNTTVTLTAVLVTGLVFAGIGYRHADGHSFALAVGLGIAGLFASVAVLVVFAALALACFFIVDWFLSLPPWGPYWSHYDVTRQYLLEGCGTLVTLGLIGWLSRRAVSVPVALGGFIAEALLVGFCGLAIASASFIPLLIVGIPLDLVGLSLPAGLLGALAGAILGTVCGTLIGVLSTFAGQILSGF